MPAKKSRNCKTQAPRIDALAVGEIVMGVRYKFIVSNTELGLPEYKFDVGGMRGVSGIEAIAAKNHGRASARKLAQRMLVGILPQGIYASDDHTRAWIALRRAEERAQGSSGTSIYIEGDGVTRICDGVETYYYYTSNGYVWSSDPDAQVCAGLRSTGVTLMVTSTDNLLKTIRLHSRIARIQARAEAAR